MSAPAGRLDVFLREGFAAGAAASPAPAAGRDGIGEVVRYRLEDGLEALRPRLAGGGAPFVAFVDNAVRLGERHWRRLAEETARPGGVAALTLRGPGLRTVLGAEDGDRPAPLPAPPPWLCVVERATLLNGHREALDYRTLEFALLDVGRRLAIEGREVMALDGAGPPFDARSWAGELVFRSGDALARDYARYLRRHPGDPDRVPPQFRLESLGRFIPCPETSDRPDRPGPRFSVVCPVFKPDFLAEMVRSVCEQTWPHWELRLIVDGPPAAELERILAVLGTIDDRRVTWSRQDNRGTGPTRRRLAQESRGDFVVSIDDDSVVLRIEDGQIRVSKRAIGTRVGDQA